MFHPINIYSSKRDILSRHQQPHLLAVMHGMERFRYSMPQIMLIYLEEISNINSSNLHKMMILGYLNKLGSRIMTMIHYIHSKMLHLSWVYLQCILDSMLLFRLTHPTISIAQVILVDMSNGMKKEKRRKMRKMITTIVMKRRNKKRSDVN